MQLCIWLHFLLQNCDQQVIMFCYTPSPRCQKCSLVPIYVLSPWGISRFICFWDTKLLFLLATMHTHTAVLWLPVPLQNCDQQVIMFCYTPSPRCLKCSLAPVYVLIPDSNSRFICFWDTKLLFLLATMHTHTAVLWLPVPLQNCDQQVTLVWYTPSPKCQKCSLAPIYVLSRWDISRFLWFRGTKWLGYKV